MTTETRSRPILFSGPMVRAILDGRKTQTRRVVKLRDPTQTYSVFGDDGWPESADEYGDWNKDPCPFGQPGDRLWVRETWMPVGRHPDPGSGTGRVFYRADYFEHEWSDLAREAGDHWRPSIHMPRWASRITLEVVGVRVERVQDISEQDAEAEGIDYWDDFAKHRTKFCRLHHPAYDDNMVCVDPGWCECMDHSIPEIFGLLWDSINAARGYGWDANPWVWVVEFKAGRVR